MKNLCLFLAFIILLPKVGKSQMCNTTPTNMGVLTLTSTWQNTAANSGAKRYWTFNATAGCTYGFSSCNSINTNDTYLRLYSGANPLTAVLQTSNDDNGPWCTGTKASISWVCPTTGVYSILLTNWSCANISSNSILSYRVICSPPYNPCLTIPTINCGVLTSLSVASGNGIYNPPSTSCGFSTPGKEYIYSFTPTVTGNYQISQPTSFGYIDYFYKVASGGCSGTGWTCIDDITNANIGNASVNIALTSGVTYYILLDPESTVGGSVSFSITCPVPVVAPANNDCSGAISISSLPYNSGVVSNNNSTDDVPTSTSGCSSQGSNVWYTVVGNGNNLTATTCNSSTNFDTEVRVYTGSCASLNSMVEVTCNDDYSSCASSGLQSSVTWCSLSGTTYYISVGYFASGVGYGNYVLSVTDGVSCSPLPIELISFTGDLMDNNSVLLKWTTETETNNNYFLVEKSLDGINWSHVSKVQGAGNSLYRINYSTIDNSPIIGVNYYKLTQVDYNGQRESFNIIAVELTIDMKKCSDIFYDLMGREIDITTASPGIYLQKCDKEYKKIIKQ